MKTNKLTKETIKDFGMMERSFPHFSVGDTIAVSQWVIEEDLQKKGADAVKKRIQIFEGDVMAFHKSGSSTTFTVRKMGANSVHVERIYPYYSPIIESIVIVSRGDVRRAKLNYVRNRVGKKAQIKLLVLSKEQREKSEKKHKAHVVKRNVREAEAVKRFSSES